MKVSKFFLMVSTVVFILSSSVLTINAQSNETLVDKQKELAVDEDIYVEVMTEEVSELKELERDLEQIDNFISSLEEENFVEVFIEDENSKIKYSTLTEDGKFLLI